MLYFFYMILRAVFFSLPRMIVIALALALLGRFDPSPLPENATILLLSYLVHVLVTMGFAYLVLRREATVTWSRVGWLALIFALGEFLLENLYVMLFQGVSLTDVVRVGVSIQTPIILFLYAGAVYLTGYLMKRHAPVQDASGIVI